MTKILVVDDEEHNRELLKDFLEVKNYEVITANNGKEALEKIKDGPDIVLLDIQMPVMNGLKALKKIKEMSPSIPVIMVSSMTEHDIAVGSIKIGAADYVTKPIDFNHLEDVINVAIIQKPTGEESIPESENQLEKLVSEETPQKAVIEDMKKTPAVVKGSDKRRCRRFEVPGAEGCYKKSGLNALIKSFSKTYPVANISKGGLAFKCEEKLRKDQKITFQLMVPNEPPLNLRSIIRRVDWSEANSYGIICLEFMPFGNSSSGNPIDALNILRRLDEQYGE